MVFPTGCLEKSSAWELPQPRLVGRNDHRYFCHRKLHRRGLSGRRGRLLVHGPFHPVLVLCHRPERLITASANPDSQRSMGAWRGLDVDWHTQEWLFFASLWKGLAV